MTHGVPAFSGRVPARVRTARPGNSPPAFLCATRDMQLVSNVDTQWGGTEGGCAGVRAECHPAGARGLLREGGVISL